MKTIRPLVLAALTASLWGPAHVSAVDLFKRVAVAKSAQPAPGHLVGTAAVEFDPVELGAMKVGESAWMDMPNGRRYEIVLDRLERHADGDLTWTGHVAGAPRDQPVLVTLGRAGTYASFTLPDGNWGAVPGEGNDWLFDADFSELHVDRSRNDARFPDQSGAPQAKADPVCSIITTTPTPQQTIDVLVLMAPDFVSTHGGAANANTRINSLLTNVNTYYANSKIAITLRRVATVNVTHPTAAEQDSLAGPLTCDTVPEHDSCDGRSLDLVSQASGNFANVPLLRSLYGADMVLFMRGRRQSGGISGVAWVGGYDTQPMSTQGAYMVSVNGDGPGFTGTLLAHEMGHNMGNNHDPSNAGTTTPGATSYAYGYTRCGSSPSATCPTTGGFPNAGTGGFGTIMSYWRPTIGRFSNPNDTCSGNGSPTVACSALIASGSPAFSVIPDETRTINCTRQAIGAFRTAHVADCASPTQDTDNDGVPNCVEQALGMNLGARDNDIFSASRTSSLQFAMQQYRDFLAREGDADGLNYWTSALFGGGQTRGAMVEGYFNSAEFQGAIAPVARLYFAYFLRIPDYPGLSYWIGQFRGGTSLSAISAAFAGSPEFISTYGSLSNSQFVSLVYNNILGRAPDAAGLTYWTGQLTGGLTRGNMMVSFSESPEYLARINSEIYVTMIYVGMLRRAPDQAGFNFWTGYLDGGNSGQALINGFLGAAEYRNRFLP